MSAQFWVLNTAGKVAWHAGRGLYRAGLALCGLSGWLDARADQYPGEP